MKRVFISHPYKDDPKGNKKRVDTICRELAERTTFSQLAPYIYLALWRMTITEKKYSRYVSGLLIYAMRFGYTATAKGVGKKGNMLFPEGKRFSKSVVIKSAFGSFLFYLDRWSIKLPDGI
jgi:hypothetical protein